MRTALAFLFITGTASGFAENSATPADISRQLTQPVVVSGTFTQVRSVNGVPEGLSSEGEYLFWRDHGIYWRTEKPVSLAITYRRDKTLYWDSEHKSVTERNIQADRHLRRLLMKILSFDQKQITAEFDMHWQTDTPTWELRLEPVQQGTRRFLNSVTLRGKNTIEGINIVQANGETLDISFNDNRVTGAMSALDCISRFNYSAERCQRATDAQAH